MPGGGVTTTDQLAVPRGVVPEDGVPPETVPPNVWSFNGSGVLHFMQLAAVAAFSV